MNYKTVAEEKKCIRTKFLHYLFALAQILLGSIILGIMAQVAIPLPYTPVPMTLQTLAVALLAISLGSTKAPLAIIAYLVQATAGLPVLAGGVVNPLWMVGPRAGYLLTCIFTSFLVAKLLERFKPVSFIKTGLILSLNELCILFIGSLWLGHFVGWENAFSMGVLPFLPAAVVKVMVATTSYRPVQWVKEQR
jgi:biotin transport system substrate-specific component